MLDLVAALLLSSVAAPTLDAAARDQAVQSVAADVERRYVDPALGKKLAASLRTKAKAHGYDALSDPEALAEALTRDLREVGHDKHLGVFYSAEPLHPIVLDGPPKFTPDRLEKLRARAARNNFGLKRVERLSGNIGLLAVTSLPHPELAGETVTAAMKLLNQTDALILDLRGNGGGFPDTAALYDGWLLPEPTHVHDVVWREWPTVEIVTPSFPAAGHYPGKEVYVLVDGNTISAGEQLANDLKLTHRATIVGETTAGGANPTVGLPVNAHFVAAVPMGRGVSAISHKSWEGVGVIPDVRVLAKDALVTAQRLALEALAKRVTDPEQLDEIQKALAELAS